jgi:hypothetical protein
MLSTGHLIQQLTYMHDDDGPYITQIFGISWADFMDANVGCGGVYTMPAVGRLSVQAELLNYYNKFHYSVEDLFGFSEAEFDIELRVYCHIRFQNQNRWFYKTLKSDGLVSHGSDLAYQMQQLDNGVPYSLEITTDESFPANANIEVFAGASLHIYSDMDDMRSHVDGTAWWRLNHLTVDVVP